MTPFRRTIVAVLALTFAGIAKARADGDHVRARREGDAAVVEVGARRSGPCRLRPSGGSGPGDTGCADQ